MLTWLHHAISADLSAANSCCKSPYLHIPKVSYWIQIRCLGRTLNSLSCSWNQIEVTFLLCDTMYYLAGSSHVQTGRLKPWRDAHGQQQYSNRLWHSSDDWLVLTSSKWAKKTLSTPLHHRHQPGMLTQGRLGPWIHAVGAKFWPYHLYASAKINKINQTRLRFSSL